MRSIIHYLLVSLVMFSPAPAPMWAQRTTATFAGIVTDSTGAVLPGAEVQLVNEGTSAAMQQLASETGEFIFDYVPVGTYTLKIAMAGFKTYESRAIPLGAAQNVRRTYVLEVGSITDRVTVTGEAPLVNTLSPEQRSNLETVEVRNLPMANRNVTGILDIAPGLNKQAAVEGASAGRFVLNGLGGSAMTVTANGTDANTNAGSVQIAGYFGFTKIDIMSSESVAEVQFVKGVIPAEYGSAMAGNLSLITKSGTNEWHGSLFHRYEGSVLSARPQFLAHENNSVWNQFGGSLGGQIKKDRAFFFFAYEGYRQRTSVPLNATVPTQRFRDIMLTSLPFPETRLLLDYYPLPTEPTATDALTGVFNGPGAKMTDDDHIDAKIDALLGGGNLSVTYAGGHPSNLIPLGLPTTPRSFTSRSRRVSANYVIGRGWWTSFTRAGYNYNWLARVDKFFNIADPNKTETVPNSRRVPGISFPGMSGLLREKHVRGFMPSYSFEQHFAFVRGTHSFKFGGILSLPSGGLDKKNPDGISYLTIQDVMANRPNSVSFSDILNAALWRMVNFGFFVQDDWRVNRKLVLNLGVRYDRYDHFVANPKNPDFPAGLFNLDGLRNPVTFEFGPLRDPNNPFESDNLSIGPRFGFAYTADNKGDFVVRGGFGVNFQSFDPQIYESRIGRTVKIPSSRSFSRAEIDALGLKFPVYAEDMAKIIEAQAGDQPLVDTRYDPTMPPPYAMNFTLGIQRALTSSLVLETAFVGTRGVKFTLYRTYNELDRVTGLRPTPNDQSGTYIDASQQTSYYSWQTSLRQRLARGLLFNAHHTWAKAMAYTGGDIAMPALFEFGTASGIQDFDQVKIEHSPAAGDITHNFVADWVYEVPTPFANSAVARQVLGGWTVSGIWKAQTGIPMTVTQTGGRPDLVDLGRAINKNCCSYGNLQYLNPAAFQAVPVSSASSRTIRRGHMGNNSLRRPGFTNLDLSLGKSFSVGERKSLELKGDMLNALNQTQYRQVSTNLNTVNFGQITGTAGARVIQLQLRLAF